MMMLFQKGCSEGGDEKDKTEIATVREREMERGRSGAIAKVAATHTHSESSAVSPFSPFATVTGASKVTIII